MESGGQGGGRARLHETAVVAVGDNSFAPDKTQPVFVGLGLSLGTTSGTIRTDASHRYQLVYGKGAGAAQDRALIHSARIRAGYS